jgi:hypothetical protein
MSLLKVDPQFLYMIAVNLCNLETLKNTEEGEGGFYLRMAEMFLH